MTTELFEATGDLCSSPGTSSDYTCSADCRPFTTEDYTDLLWTTLAEFPGNFFKASIFSFKKINCVTKCYHFTHKICNLYVLVVGVFVSFDFIILVS